jgi:hypothetical protein
VAGILRSHGFDAWRTPNSGGLRIKGDVLGWEGFHLEVKRQETLRVPDWLRQAYLEAADGGVQLVPVVAFRCNRATPLEPIGRWHAIVPLDVLAALIGSREPTPS